MKTIVKGTQDQNPNEELTSFFKKKTAFPNKTGAGRTDNNTKTKTWTKPKTYDNKKPFNKSSNGKPNSNYKTKSYGNKSNSSAAGNGEIQFKQRREIDEPTKNLRRLYNKLMIKETKKTKKYGEDKPALIAKIMKLIGNNYAEYCFKHDTCRILQGSIKFGNEAQRAEIIQALKPQVLSLIMKKYSIYLAVKIMKFADNEAKEDILKNQIFPHFSKLLKNPNGQVFMNFMYKNSNATIQKMLTDYYYKSYLKMSLNYLTENVDKKNVQVAASESIIVEKSTTYMGDQIVQTMKEHIEKQLERTVHKTYIFQTVLNEIFDLFDTRTKVYISEIFDDDFNDFLFYKNGVTIACKMFTVAQPKTRKKVLKNLKKITIATVEADGEGEGTEPATPSTGEELLANLFGSEVTAVFIIKVILSFDDTKLLGKYILKPLIPLIRDQLLYNKVAPKIILNILQLYNTKANHPHEQAIIAYNTDSSSKKDDLKRQEEIWAIMGNDIHEILTQDDIVKKMLLDNNLSNLLLDLITFYTMNIDHFKANLEGLLTVVNRVILEDFKQNGTDKCILADKVGHYNVNKVMKKVFDECSCNTIKNSFVEGLCNVFKMDLRGFLDTKAVFIIVRIVENESVKAHMIENLAKHKKYIVTMANEKNLVGFQYLNKVI